MRKRAGWTIEIGDAAELSQKTLREWRDMTPAQRIRYYEQLVEDWWPRESKRLARTYRVVSREQR
ncbi:MAG: hypothetical protein ACHQ50_16985 [Fimbriimonadales bacterium]